MSHKNNKEYQKKWYFLNKKKQIERNNIRKRNIRERFKKYKSTLKCSVCGESHPACLDFHHIDKKDKVKEIYDVVKKGWGWVKIMEEISKCQVICANCHRKIHWNELK